MRVLGVAIVGVLVLSSCGGKGGDSETVSASESSSSGGGSGSTAGTTMQAGSSGGGSETGGSGSSGGSTSAGGTSTGGTGTGGTSTGGTGTSGTSSGGTSSGGTSSGGESSGGSTGADLCPEGTCTLFDGGPCEKPTGPVGNGCCACGPDDKCSAFCRCAAPDTPIATPAGERAIAGLRPGDLVLSVDEGRVVAVPVLEVSKVPAPAEHSVVRLHLDSGRTIEMSPGHPTAEGRLLRELAVGEALGEARITRIERVGYAHAYTHDILPDSDSGAYFAAGALVGSTLKRASPGLACE